MMAAESVTAAAALIIRLLDDLPAVYGPPHPTIPVAPPCVLIGTPTVIRVRPLGTPGGPTFELGGDVVVVAADTTGNGLLALVDTTLLALAAAGLRLTTDSVFWTAGNPAGPLPAVRIRWE